MPTTSAASLPAALVLSRLKAKGAGVTWSASTWSAIWRRLTAEQRDVVYLLAVVGLDVTSAAGELQVTPPAVRQCYRRAVERMVELVELQAA